MRVFNDVDEFLMVLGKLRKWHRVVEAVENSENIEELVMHSIGDSLTYLKLPNGYNDKLLCGQRRYQTVVVALKGNVEVEFGTKTAFEEIVPYSDLNDREEFQGVGQHLTLKEGELMLLSIDEACRVNVPATSQGLKIKVTVEGRTFANK
ncbi:MAG: hypothetical protein ACOX5I_06205 [Gleimia sp.]|jgi:evolved beta-galactosidase subunit beta